MPRIDVSSTALRAARRAGRSLRHWVPDAVAHEIAARGLYRRGRGGCRAERDHRMNATAELTSEQLVELIAEYALDKKAQDVLSLDLRGLSGFTDAFVVVLGNERPPGEGDPRRDPLRAEEGPRAAAAARRGSRRVALDPDGLPRRRGARLHARGARLLPPRGAVGRRPAPHFEPAPTAPASRSQRVRRGLVGRRPRAARCADRARAVVADGVHRARSRRDDGQRSCYSDTGAGPLVVLFHGFPDTADGLGGHSGGAECGGLPDRRALPAGLPPGHDRGRARLYGPRRDRRGRDAPP